MKEDMLNQMVMGHSYRHSRMNTGFLAEIRAAVAIMNKRNDQRPKKHAEDEDAQDVPDIDPAIPVSQKKGCMQRGPGTWSCVFANFPFFGRS